MSWGRRHAVSGTDTEDAQGYDAASYQHLGIDGYTPEPVIPTFQQAGKYRLPLASVSNQNNGGLRRNDVVGDLDNGPNVYMPIWSAPSRGAVVNLVGGRAENPMNSYAAGQQQANQFSANADQASALAQFLNSKSPRYAGMSALSGE